MPSDTVDRQPFPGFPGSVTSRIRAHAASAPPRAQCCDPVSLTPCPRSYSACLAKRSPPFRTGHWLPAQCFVVSSFFRQLNAPLRIVFFFSLITLFLLGSCMPLFSGRPNRPSDRQDLWITFPRLLLSPFTPSRPPPSRDLMFSLLVVLLAYPRLDTSAIVCFSIVVGRPCRKASTGCILDSRSPLVG